VGVASQVGETACGRRTALGIDHPLALRSGREEGRNAPRLGKRGVGAKEREVSNLVGREELDPQQRRNKRRETRTGRQKDLGGKRKKESTIKGDAADPCPARSCAGADDGVMAEPQS